MQRRFYVPTKAVDDWKNLLADPAKHWKLGFSAQRLATAWETAVDIPTTVRNVFDGAAASALNQLELLIGLPEHQVALPPVGARPSQTDLWLLARSPQGLISIAVEGKVEESFGPSVADWAKEGSPGRLTRLKALCDILEIAESQSHGIRYQLLHRAASAIVEAKRFRASHACMLVHSFSAMDTGLSDYQKFCEAFGAGTPAPNAVVAAGFRNGVQLYLGWVRG